MTGISWTRKILALLLFLMIIPVGYWLYKTYDKSPIPSKSVSFTPSKTDSPAPLPPLDFVYGKLDSLDDTTATVDGKPFVLAKPITFGRYKADSSVMNNEEKKSEVITKRPLPLTKNEVSIGDYVQLTIVNDQSKYPQISSPGVVQIVIFKP